MPTPDPTDDHRDETTERPPSSTTIDRALADVRARPRRSTGSSGSWPTGASSAPCSTPCSSRPGTTWACRWSRSGSLAEIPEPARTQYEERYVEAIRARRPAAPRRRRDRRRLALLPGHRREGAGRRGDRGLRAGRERRAARPGRRGRVQPGGPPAQGVRADPGALRHLLGDLGLRVAPAATRRPGSPAPTGWSASSTTTSSPTSAPRSPGGASPSRPKGPRSAT